MHRTEYLASDRTGPIASDASDVVEMLSAEGSSTISASLGPVFGETYDAAVAEAAFAACSVLAARKSASVSLASCHRHDGD